MKALYFDGSKLNLTQNFTFPKTEEALVKVIAAGICGTDLEILKGYMSYVGVPGHEFVGVVEESSIKELIGKRVVGEINVGCQRCKSCFSGLERHCPNRSVLGILNRDGAFAQYLSLPNRNLHVIPDSISSEEAVFIEPLASAFEILEQIHIEPSWRLAIVGDGRLGQLIARVLRMSHPNITCFGRHDKKLKILQNLGLRTKKEITIIDEKNFDLVVEATGKETGFADTIRLVKPRGTVILKSTITTQNKLNLSPIIINEVKILGSRCGPFLPAIKSLETGIISVKELVDFIFPLEKYEKAFEETAKKESLKIILKP